MTPTTSFEASRLIRRLRQEAELTQRELAERLGTTQSVISRLESDDYEGHSLSMLYRVGAALNRKIAVTATGEGARVLSVREDAPPYGPASAADASDASDAHDEGLHAADFDRLARRIARRFAAQGVTEADVREAIRWARGGAPGRSLEELRGAITVGPGDVVDDVRRARAQRGRDTGRER